MKDWPTVALASRSPRRRELLEQLRVRVVQVDGSVDERRQAGEAPTSYVERLGVEKALAGAANLASRDLPVIAGDTAVATEDRIHDKPTDRESAVSTLMHLSGRWHEVHTSVALTRAGLEPVVRVVSSRVKFRRLSEAEAHAYWNTGEPCDKAGAYAIQGLGASFVERLEGSFSAVMGLPVFETAQLLRLADVNVLQTAGIAA